MIKVVNIVLTLAVFGVGYLLVQTLQEPIKFKAESEKRDALVIDKLTYIKDLQLAFKDENGHFASTFDSLGLFLANDSMKITKIIGDRDQLDAEGNAMEVRYEITKIPVKDTLANPLYAATDLASVPGVEGEKFDIETRMLERGRIMVPVYEIGVGYDRMFKGLKEKYIDKSQTRKIGSLYEANYNGNW